MKNIIAIALLIVGLILGYSIEGNIQDNIEINSCSYQIIIKE